MYRSQQILQTFMSGDRYFHGEDGADVHCFFEVGYRSLQVLATTYKCYALNLKSKACIHIALCTYT